MGFMYYSSTLLISWRTIFNEAPNGIAPYKDVEITNEMAKFLQFLNSDWWSNKVCQVLYDIG